MSNGKNSCHRNKGSNFRKSIILATGHNERTHVQLHTAQRTRISSCVTPVFYCFVSGCSDLAKLISITAFKPTTHYFSSSKVSAVFARMYLFGLLLTRFSTAPTIIRQTAVKRLRLSLRQGVTNPESQVD